MGFLRLLYLAAQVLVKGLRAVVLRRLLCWSLSGYRLGRSFISCSRSMLQPAIRITVAAAFGGVLEVLEGLAPKFLTLAWPRRGPPVLVETS